MAPSTHDKEKKSKWRSMLGGGRDAKEDNTSHLRPGPDPDPDTSSKDSAYGSQRTSGQPSPRPQSSEPSETNVKQDPSTGNIVTTTVTTTTTTTTVTTRNGTVIETVSSPTVEADATSRIRDSDGSTSTPAVQNIRPHSEHFNQGISGPADSRRNPAPNAPHQINNSNNPAELDATIQGAASGGRGGGADGPPIPVKSNKRKSREIHMPWPRPSGLPRPTSELTEPPVSPVTPSHNFSYPARTSPHVSQLSLQDPRQSYPEQPQHGHQLHQGQPPYAGQYPELYQGQHPYQHPPSDAGQNGVADSTNRQNDRPGTWQNLKTVASGVHGAGEVLRGTVNSKIIDRHAPPQRQGEYQQVVHQGADELKRFYGSQGKGWLAAMSRKPVGDDGAA